MPKLIRRTAILAKIEATAGVDPTPTGAANAMMVRNVSISPMEQELESRERVRPFLGNSEQIVVAVWAKMEFEVELAGAGAAGTAPKYGPLLRACGFAETITAGVSVAYAPVSTAFEHITIYINVDGVLHEMNYGAGSVSLSLNARKMPFYKFSFTGLYQPVVDATPPAPDYSGFIKPLAVNKANTPTFTLHGTSGVLESLQLDMKNEVVYRNLVNSETVNITDRKPDGSCSFEATSVATKDWWAAMLAGTTGALSMVHGVTAGNILDLAAPTAQLVSPKFGDSNGIQMLQTNLILACGASGNDELTITVR